MSDVPKWREDVAADVHRQRIYWYCIPIGFVFGAFVGAKTGQPLLCLVLGPIVMTAIGLGLYHTLVAGTASLVSGAVLPDDRGGGGVAYSHIEALEARGDIGGALAAWEHAIATNPRAVAARVNAADLYVRKGANPTRAAELFRELQSHEKASDETRRYASQRLIDLYLGVLADEGRALVELRKLADRWPDSPEGRGAARAIADIKASRRRSP
jgi:hypothetical protein